jgi:hypothetical protein
MRCNEDAGSEDRAVAEATETDGEREQLDQRDLRLATTRRIAAA